jgi:hypothetical protein
LVGDAEMIIERLFALCQHHQSQVKNLAFTAMESIMRAFSDKLVTNTAYKGVFAVRKYDF